MACEHCTVDGKDLGCDWSYQFEVIDFFKVRFKDNILYKGDICKCTECGKWNIIARSYFVKDDGSEDFNDGGDWKLTDEERASITSDKAFEDFILNTQKGQDIQSCYGEVERLE